MVTISLFKVAFNRESLVTIPFANIISPSDTIFHSLTGSKPSEQKGNNKSGHQVCLYVHRLSIFNTYLVRQWLPKKTVFDV